jgi:hypothetical protein
MIVLFFISAFLFPGRLSIPGAVGMLLVLFSPASMLLYERGNVDLIVFVLCVLIVLAAGVSAGLAAFLLALSSIIKLFPFFGITVLFKESRNRFLVLLAGCLAVLVLYMAATWESVSAAWNFTMRGDGLSYGTNVFVTRYETAITDVLQHWFTPHRTDLLLGYLPLAAGLVLLLLVFILALSSSWQPAESTGRNVDAFRMGASIYVGTFLLGNNFDYRLAFLVLTVPQLVEWMRTEDKRYRLLAWSSMALILVSCWHLWIVEIPLTAFFRSPEDSRKFWIVLDEVFNWLLFAGLGCLLFVSAPAWIKELSRRLLPVRGANARREPTGPTVP